MIEYNRTGRQSSELRVPLSERNDETETLILDTLKLCNVISCNTMEKGIAIIKSTTKTCFCEF